MKHKQIHLFLCKKIHHLDSGRGEKFHADPDRNKDIKEFKKMQSFYIEKNVEHRDIRRKRQYKSKTYLASRQNIGNISSKICRKIIHFGPQYMYRPEKVSGNIGEQRQVTF